MTCHEVQINLSLYLYGELDFAQEEALEEHLDSCAFCESTLRREKSWHATLNAQHTDVPLPLLAECRQNLKQALPVSAAKSRRDWASFLHSFGFSLMPWSGRIAAASFLLFLGFGAGAYWNKLGLPGGLTSGPSVATAGFLDPATTRVREVQPRQGNQVRVLVEQVWQRELVGPLGDKTLRQLVLAASKDPNDPGLRVDSVEAMKDQSGADIREALLYAIQHDTNAGVRLKALEGLQRFADDPETRQSLAFVLEHDDNPGVRSQAIDLLVPGQPGQRQVEFSPELAEALQQAVRSRQNDEYVRMRCLQVLGAMKASPDVY